MSESFPYFSLSKRLRLPYPQVLDRVSMLEGAEPRADDRRQRWPLLEPMTCREIYDAWRGEVTRRRAVEEEER